jgi:hypothetical protein
MPIRPHRRRPHRRRDLRVWGPKHHRHPGPSARVPRVQAAALGPGRGRGGVQLTAAAQAASDIAVGAKPDSSPRGRPGPTGRAHRGLLDRQQRVEAVQDRGDPLGRHRLGVTCEIPARRPEPCGTAGQLPGDDHADRGGSSSVTSGSISGVSDLPTTRGIRGISDPCDGAYGLLLRPSHVGSTSRPALAPTHTSLLGRGSSELGSVDRPRTLVYRSRWPHRPHWLPWGTRL